MELDLHPGQLAICRLAAEAPTPAWAESSEGPLASVTRTRAELSIVVAADAVPDHVRAEVGWRALSVRGPLAFSLTGVLSSLAAPLAAAGVPIFALSTFDTDWLLVGEDRLREAVTTLEDAGHLVHGDGA